MLVEAERERGCGRLVDDAQHVETGDLAGVLRGLHAKRGRAETSATERVLHAFDQLCTHNTVFVHLLV